MFDDLNDPNPPTAGMHTLANVAQRARRIRRRRSMWVGASAGALVVAATIGTLVATGDDAADDNGRIVNIAPGNTDNTGSTASTDDTGITDDTGNTDNTGNSTASSDTVSTAGDPEATLGSESPTSPADSIGPDRTDVTSPSDVTTATPTTAATAVTTTSTPPATTTTVVLAPRPVVAIDANGDAVIVNQDGTTTLLYDGPDPDEPLPDEGETSDIDAVAVTNNQSVAFVGTCCEPIPGTILRFALPDTSTFDTTFGHAPSISPDGTKVATDVLGLVSVSDLSLAEIASTDEDFLGTAAGSGIVWIDERRFVVLTALPDTAGLQSLTLTADNTLQAGPSWSVDDVDGFGTSLGGIGDGVIYVAGLQDAILTAFDSNTLQPLPARNITLPGDALSAWLQAGELRWVDQDRRLHIGNTIVPGEFIWVR